MSPPVSRCVLDASAVLAYLHREAGHERIEPLMEEGVISAVNLSEVASKLAERGAREDSIRDILGELGLSAVPFDETLAYRAASLRRSTQALGLSLGDRACLATAALLGVRAVTADRAWEKLKLPVKVVVVR